MKWFISACHVANAVFDPQPLCCHSCSWSGFCIQNFVPFSGFYLPDFGFMFFRIFRHGLCSSKWFTSVFIMENGSIGDWNVKCKWFLPSFYLSSMEYGMMWATHTNKMGISLSLGLIWLKFTLGIVRSIPFLRVVRLWF